MFIFGGICGFLFIFNHLITFSVLGVLLKLSKAIFLWLRNTILCSYLLVLRNYWYTSSDWYYEVQCFSNSYHFTPLNLSQKLVDNQYKIPHIIKIVTVFTIPTMTKSKLGAHLSPRIKNMHFGFKTKKLWQFQIWKV